MHGSFHKPVIPGEVAAQQGAFCTRVVGVCRVVDVLAELQRGGKKKLGDGERMVN